MSQRILIADDHPVVRVGVRAIIDIHGMGDVVGEAGTVDELFKLLAEQSVDVLVTDLSMPGPTQIDGYAMIERICRNYPYQLAAWRLRKHLQHDRGDVWTRAANYHSRTPRHNARYRHQLMRKAHQWSQWLGRQFNTHTVDGVGARLEPPLASWRGEGAFAGSRHSEGSE